ncbi:MAG: hypothetical protein P8077_04325 [Gammaproteobacteria bacterium]
MSCFVIVLRGADVLVAYGVGMRLFYCRVLTLLWVLLVYNRVNWKPFSMICLKTLWQHAMKNFYTFVADERYEP